MADFIAFAQRADAAAGLRFEMNYLDWLCLRNPVGSAKLIIAELAGVIVGGMIMVPVPLTLNGAIVPAWFVANVLTDPNHRKLGLFSRMIVAAKAYAADRAGWVIGHPNQAAFKGWQRAEMSFQPSLVPRLVWLSRPQSILRHRPISELTKVLKSSASRSGTAKVGALDLLRSPEFMAWRFVSRPDVKYKLLVHEQSGRVESFFVVRSWRFGLDLVVDACVSDSARGRRLGFLRPTIVPVSDSASAAALSDSVRSVIRVDTRALCYFADGVAGPADGGRLTLAVSDF